jgi:hypothetical protein
VKLASSQAKPKKGKEETTGNASKDERKARVTYPQGKILFLNGRDE